MKNRISLFLLLLLLSLLYTPVIAQTINPLDYGINEAKTGVARYEVLLKCHKDAVKLGAKVSYAGIREIDLEIPAKFTSIPLTEDTDFAGCTITVTNTKKRACLFAMTSTLEPIDVSAKAIDESDFRSVKALSNGTYLLVITDKNPWADQRIGHDYGHNRNDVMLVKDGKGYSKPTMPYCNPHSLPECSYREVSEREKVVCNLHFVRSANSTAITTLVKIENENNITIHDITVKTPQESDLKADQIFSIMNCTNVTFVDLMVEGTYSSTNDNGYAFLLNNVWNHTARNVVANGAWGVYGTNDVQKVLLDGCEINRFDIHCYGRDVTARNCTFFDLYNQFGSVYGKIEYKNCIFRDSSPFVTGGSYKAFVPVDVSFADCVFNISKDKYSFVKIMKLAEPESPRAELKKKCLPNFTLNNCTFIIGPSVKQWYFFNLTNAKGTDPLGYVSGVTLKKVTINGDAAFDISNVAFDTEKPLSINFNKVYKTSGSTKDKYQMQPVTVGRNTTVKCNRKVVEKK